MGAPSALVPHAAKSALRVASTTFTAGLANPVLSLLEDVAALVLFVLAVLVRSVVPAAGAANAFFVLRKLLRRAAAVRHAPAP